MTSFLERFEAFMMPYCERVARERDAHTLLLVSRLICLMHDASGDILKELCIGRNRRTWPLMYAFHNHLPVDIVRFMVVESYADMTDVMWCAYSATHCMQTCTPCCSTWVAYLTCRGTSGYVRRYPVPRSARPTRRCNDVKTTGRSERC